MSNKALEKICLEFRRGILARRSAKGQCWFISTPLQGYLSLLGHETELVQGFVRGEGHYWLKRPDGTIVDATADQFLTPRGERMPKVYIGKKPRWYREVGFEQFFGAKKKIAVKSKKVLDARAMASI